MNAYTTRRFTGLKDAGVRALLAFYKRVVSPALHAVAGTSGACRFQPTCSEYAAIAIAEHGVLRGTMMALGRLLRCHPLHRGGFDPVPAKHSGAASVQAGQVH
ncbi:MAG: membrane protein insertion efficiency factor YidD [Acidobacteriaceae bacterium]